jgi:Skp family chaperone for outer membrane proteins
MAGLAQIIPGGKLDLTASGVSPDVASRLKKREEEEQGLREDLKSKEEKLRKSLKNWDKLSRESGSMALRSELSERHVRMLAGEGVGGAAF